MISSTNTTGLRLRVHVWIYNRVRQSPDAALVHVGTLIGQKQNRKLISLIAPVFTCYFVSVWLS